MKKMISFVLGILMAVTLGLPVYAATDTVSPGDVEKLTVTPYDGAAGLKWDAATDNVGVKGYKVYWGTSSVTKAGQDYDKNSDVGNVLEYTVNGLNNGTKYYFSVVAYDAAGNESQAWAPEASATPASGSGAYMDKTSPQVANAEASNEEEVKVKFSEEIVLPSDNPENEFSIENTDNFEPLDVLKAEMDKDDETNKTVILTTDKQEGGAEYQLTVGINLEDKSGNPIISGTSDTAVFDGSDSKKDSDEFKLVEAEVVDSTHVLLTFNTTVVLGTDPAENFTISEENDATKTLAVLGVELGKNNDGVEDASALLTVSEMADTSYEVLVSGVTDEQGTEISEENGKVAFDGKTGMEPKDITPPKDVLGFLVKQIVAEAQKYNVKLGWENPVENETDTAEQILYVSQGDDQNFEKDGTVDNGENSNTVKGLEPGDYWFKLTQVDAAGNESKGVITKVTLAETGPEMLGLVLVSLGLGRLFRKKK